MNYKTIIINVEISDVVVKSIYVCISLGITAISWKNKVEWGHCATCYETIL